MDASSQYWEKQILHLASRFRIYQIKVPYQLACSIASHVGILLGRASAAQYFSSTYPWIANEADSQLLEYVTSMHIAAQKYPWPSQLEEMFKKFGRPERLVIGLSNLLSTLIT